MCSNKLVILNTLLILCTVRSHSDSGKMTIAVSNLSPIGIEREAAILIADRIRTGLINTGVFSVIEREKMEEIFKEMEFQYGDACDEKSCAVEAGRILGVERIVIGNVGRVQDIYVLSLRMVDVGSGEILVSVNEDCRCTMEYVLSHAAAAVAEKLEMAVQRERFGSLKIASVPDGASLVLNGRETGKTPFSSDMMIPGTYGIELSHSACNPLVDSVSVKASESIVRTFRLEYKKEYLDSLTFAKRKKRIRLLVIRQSILGTATIALAGCGYWMNDEMREQVEAKKALQRNYDEARSDFNEFLDNRDDIQAEIDKYSITRNILYTLAGTCLTGFAVSFFF